MQGENGVYVGAADLVICEGDYRASPRFGAGKMAERMEKEVVDGNDERAHEKDGGEDGYGEEEGMRGGAKKSLRVHVSYLYAQM